MRFLKILLITISVACIVMLSFLLDEFSSLNSSQKVPAIIFVLLIVFLLLSVANIIYHILSFRFYRSSKKQRLDDKLHTSVWVTGFSFPGFIFVLISIALYNNSPRFVSGYFRSEGFLFLLLLLVVASLEFMEISLLKKRIKRLQEAYEVKNEIDDIGKTS
jgi:amino acid transporter